MLWLILCMIKLSPIVAQFSMMDTEGSTEEAHKTNSMPLWGNSYGSGFQHGNNYGMTQATNSGSSSEQLRQLLSDFYSATYWQHYNKLMASRSTTTISPPTTIFVPTRPNYQPYDSNRHDFSLANSQYQSHTFYDAPQHTAPTDFYQTTTTQSPIIYHTTGTTAESSKLSSERHWQFDRSSAMARSSSNIIQRSPQRYPEMTGYQRSSNESPFHTKNQYNREPVRQDTNRGSNGSAGIVSQLYNMLFWNAILQNSNTQHATTNNFG
ncbi:hypothetical protein ACF0H5_020019 [Mactra antiquata]